MYKDQFMNLISNISFVKVTSFIINYKECDFEDDPIMTIKLEENNEESDPL